ncbi:MAG: DnaA ATPase domain-containing protein, partial [Planctomycetota bacterium]
MVATGNEIWQTVSARFERLRGRQATRLWLADARPASLRRGLFTLDVASPAAKTAIDARYLCDLQSLFLEVTGSPVRVLTRVADEESEPVEAELPTSRLPPARFQEMRSVLPQPEEFVVASSNRLAHRAVERFVLAPAAGWNPLLVYGPPGCGKTELARHALAGLRTEGEVKDPLVLSGPALTRDVTQAARNGGLAELRASWAGRDLLLLDEVHRLRGQVRTQTEAVHLIAGMVERGKRVLLLSRHAPHALLDVDPRLLSWQLGGMVVAMGEPDTADREAMLASIARTLPVRVDAGVVAALAARCPGSLSDAVRMLQRAAREAEADGTPLDTARLDRRLAGPTPAELGMESVLKLVAEMYDVDIERIRSADKSRKVAAARHLSVFLATRSLGLSARQVCRTLGQSSPSLVSYARRAVEKRRREDPAFDRRVHALVARLAGAQR